MVEGSDRSSLPPVPAGAEPAAPVLSGARAEDASAGGSVPAPGSEVYVEGAGTGGEAGPGAEVEGKAIPEVKARKKGPDLHPSTFQGQVFDPTANVDYKSQRSYANTLYFGTDLDALGRVQNRIDTLIEEGELPSSYNVHNPVQLLPDRTFDTTNRSVVLQAQTNNFDPEGFKKGRPLQLSIFYMDPFVTCSWCNMVTFVDVMSIRRSLALPDDVAEDLMIPLEMMPPCRQCGKADHLHVGSHDFSELIANRDRLAREKAERQLGATLVIQRCYRAYLKRMYAHAERQARIALEKLQAKAATRINACARYRLANRRAIAEYHLRVVKTSHDVLLKHALKRPKRPDRRYNIATKTFWFEREVEITLAFEDYLLLGERLGWAPSRKEMEVNFIELSKRITARKDDLLSLIQRAWRGFMARRIVVYYKIERVRLQQFLLSKAFKIQRLFRGHRVRLLIPGMLKERDDEMVMKQYADFAEKRRLKKLRGDAIIKTKAAYVKERAEERTARFTGRIDVPSLHDDRKMKAFAASCYSDNRLPSEQDKLLAMELADIAKYKKKIKDDIVRRDYLTERIDEHGPRGYGKRGFIDESVEEKVIAGIAVGPERISSRSKGMKVLVHDEIKTIMDGVVDRALHDFKGHKLPERFRAFNKEKDEARSIGILNALADRETKMQNFAIHGGGGGGGRLGGARSSVVSPQARMSASSRGSSPDSKGGAQSGSSGKGWHSGEKRVKHKKKARLYKDYKYPAGINDDPLEFLNENLDDLLAYADERAQKEAAAKVAESNAAIGTPKSPALRNKKKLK